MTKLTLTVVTLAGTEYALTKGSAGGWTFPADEFRAGESPAEAARRVVKEWTGTTEPKLELMDFRVEGDALRFVFRALLTADPATREWSRFPRMGLPDLEGSLSSKEVEEMQKTGLNYKLTRG